MLGLKRLASSGVLRTTNTLIPFSGKGLIFSECIFDISNEIKKEKHWCTYYKAKWIRHFCGLVIFWDYLNITILT